MQDQHGASAWPGTNRQRLVEYVPHGHWKTTTRGSVYLLHRGAPNRIIAWSKNIYQGDRLILWSDYSIRWVPDERVDVIARTAQETSK